MPVLCEGMLPAPVNPSAPPPGTWPLFKFRGIHVFLHWSWLLVAYYHINEGKGFFPHIGWDIAVYVSLFVIVLLHEFGHAFAARSVGGSADQILLWPFGGIAYVQTPPRPGAYLWGIAAGPLVNAMLWPLLYALDWWMHSRLSESDILADGSFSTSFYASIFVKQLYTINKVLLIFNILPVFPMDGGQLLRGLLWYKLGPIKSLRIAAWIGFVLGVGLIAYALIVEKSTWMAIVLGLMVSRTWQVIQSLRALPREPA